MPHLQLKDIPAGVHEALRLSAAAAGISMREYVLRLLEADLDTVDSREQMAARLRALPRAIASGDRRAVHILRAAREEREAELLERASSR